jgi:large subunit ribosomal protein L25
MATEILNAQTRENTGKGTARKLRADKKVPGIIYGHAREAQTITLDERELDRMLERVSADTTVFDVTIGKTVARSLIREVQRHPIRRNILHIDFQELVAGEAVTVDIPIILVGSPDGVRNQQGTLDQIMRTLSVEVDPANIPNHLDLNVDALMLNQSLHVSDIALPAGVKIVTHGKPNPVIVSANVQAAEVEEVAPVPVVAAAAPAPTKAKKTEKQNKK